jgi:hypothetical protein
MMKKELLGYLPEHQHNMAGKPATGELEAQDEEANGKQAHTFISHSGM